MTVRVQILAIGCLSILIALAMLLIPTQTNIIWAMIVGWFALVGIEVTAITLSRANKIEQRLNELTTMLKKEGKEQ